MDSSWSSVLQFFFSQFTVTINVSSCSRNWFGAILFFFYLFQSQWTSSQTSWLLPHQMTSRALTISAPFIWTVKVWKYWRRRTRMPLTDGPLQGAQAEDICDLFSLLWSANKYARVQCALVINGNFFRILSSGWCLAWDLSMSSLFVSFKEALLWLLVGFRNSFQWSTSNNKQGLFGCRSLLWIALALSCRLPVWLCLGTTCCLGIGQLVPASPS